MRHHLMQPARATFEREATPTPNQTMQRTASKLAADFLSVSFGCVARFVGFAVADLVSRSAGRGGVSRGPASYRADRVDDTGLGQRPSCGWRAVWGIVPRRPWRLTAAVVRRPR